MPHVCGDEPAQSRRDFEALPVCPTYVGMNRTTQIYLDVREGMPHVCGDEPPLMAHIRV